MIIRFATLLFLALALTCGALAQPAQRQPTPNDTLVSPEVLPDKKVAFRLYAPQATAVRLNAGDIPGAGQGTMTKAENGVWEITLGPLQPGAYRYQFNVNGVAVIDPRSPAISESNNNVSSLVYVPGSDLFDTRDVPHGAVAAVTYYSKTLKRFRRMHVYTPPGYEAGRGKYPIFYLLHGAGDCDEAWTSVGRAGFILDNLIAANKAKPMVVVMPAGHTRQGAAFRAPAGTGAPPVDEFEQEFATDIMPFAESHYRVFTDRAHRAIAGLSMGGNHTLRIGIPHLDKFAYLGVYSSGLIGAFGMNRPGAPGAQATAPADPLKITAQGEAWEKAQQARLSDAALKKGLKLFWFATGKEDFLLNTTKGTVALFQKHGFTPVYAETAGGHTWLNWRDYLSEFAPKLFQ